MQMDRDPLQQKMGAMRPSGNSLVLFTDRMVTNCPMQLSIVYHKKGHLSSSLGNGDGQHDLVLRLPAFGNRADAAALDPGQGLVEVTQKGPHIDRPGFPLLPQEQLQALPCW